MSSVGSITRYLSGLGDGEQGAYQKLWERAFRGVVGLARGILRRRPRAAADAHDVALNPFDSFCGGARQGRFPRLQDRDDLWQVLMVLTDRKASNLARHEGRLKRGGGRVVHVSALPAGPDGD